MSNILGPSSAPDVETQSKATRAREDELLGLILSRLPYAVLLLDRHWRILFANDEARRLSRIRPQDLRQSYWEVVPDSLGSPLEQLYRRCMESNTSGQIEYFCARFDIWLHVTVLPMPEGIAIHYRDDSARKRAESLRDDYADRLGQVLDATTDGIVSLDRDWNYTFLNNRAIQLLHRDDLVGKNLWQEYPAAIDSDFSAFFRRTMEQRNPSEFEAFYPAPLNLWLSIQCRPSDQGIVVFFRDITARRQTETLFREQRDLITFVQQAARIAFWNIDLVALTVAFDTGSYPVFGRPLDSINNIERVRSILHPDDLPRTRAAVGQAIRSGDLIRTEFRVFDLQGKTIWLEARAQTTVRNGKAIALGGMAIDITDRKRNEDALAVSEERYRILTELNPQFLWTGAPNGQITYANQGCLDFLGISLGKLRNGRWLNAISADDRAVVLDRWSRSRATGVDFEVEARLIPANSGEPRWFWVRALPGRDENGHISSWLGVAIDIHDRKAAADALHQKQLETERQRAEIEAVYRTAPIGLALFDPVEFRYLRLNDRQAEIIGLPQNQILGRTLTEIAPIPGLDEMFQQVLEGRPIRNALLQGELPMRPGEHRFWNVNYLPVYNADGSVQAISAATLEITNQKKAENALIQSEKLAAVGRLASSISHEINNPLEAVTNLLYLIGEHPTLSAEIRPLVELAQDEVQRVCQIATQTLRFHRQAARATLVTAQEIVDAVLHLYQGRLTNSNIQVSTQYQSTTPILCFENDIRQVLNNLIANAIDAMRQGGSLLIRAHDATEPPARTEAVPFGARSSSQRPALRKGVRITVADTGHGMSAAVRARIFEPFYTTKDLNGTGLGLWISGGIIARHHGRISLRSSDHPHHHGTVFSIFLPHIAEAQIIDADSLPS